MRFCSMPHQICICFTEFRESFYVFSHFRRFAQYILYGLTWDSKFYPYYGHVDPMSGSIWSFPKLGPSSHPFFHRIFHEMNHPASSSYGSSLMTYESPRHLFLKRGHRSKSWVQCHRSHLLLGENCENWSMFRDCRGKVMRNFR